MLYRKPLLASGSFAYMLAQYGFEFDRKDQAGQYYDDILKNVLRLYRDPFYIVMSGFSPRLDHLLEINNAGSTNHFWSSTPMGKTSAIHIDMSFSVVWPASVWERYFGFSLHCLVTARKTIIPVIIYRWVQLVAVIERIVRNLLSLSSGTRPSVNPSTSTCSVRRWPYRSRVCYINGANVFTRIQF